MLDDILISGGDVLEEKYLAHISEDGREQLLKDHLMETARLAAEFAEEFQCGDLVKPLGVLHDVGKYSHAFQGRLHGGTIVDQDRKSTRLNSSH